MSCPVSEACFKVVDAHYMGASRRFLVADFADTWRSVGDRAQHDSPMATTKRLRAFFCVETTYHLIFPGLNLPPGMVGLREQFLSSRFERSHEGLGSVLSLCEEAYRGLTIEHGEMHLSRQVNNVFAHVDALMNRPRVVTEKLELSARELRPMLRGSTQNIGRVGRLFGEVLLETETSIEMCARYLNTMLDISIHNPVSPWSMKLSPASLST